VVTNEDIVNYAAYYLLRNRYHAGGCYFIDSKLVFFFYRVLRSLNRRLNLKFIGIDLVNIDFIHRDSGGNLRYGSELETSISGLNALVEFTVPEYYHSCLDEWKNKYSIRGKFICVFARDDNYYGNSLGSIRDSEFIELVDSIKYMISMGYWVVRIGRNHVNDAAGNVIASDMYVDYGNSDDVSDILDLMLIKECRLLVTGSSGVACMQFFFRTRMLYHNAAPFGMRPQFDNCIYIMKKYEKDGVVVPYYDIPELLRLQEDKEEVEKFDYKIVDNLSCEILDVVKFELGGESCDGIVPDFRFIVSKGYASIEKQWFNKNKKLFIKGTSKNHPSNSELI